MNTCLICKKDRTGYQILCKLCWDDLQKWVRTKIDPKGYSCLDSFVGAYRWRLIYNEYYEPVKVAFT